MEYKIAVIPGDGVGNEIMTEAIETLKTVGRVYGHHFLIQEVMAGTEAVLQGMEPFTEEELKICRESDAVLMGKLALGHFSDLEQEKRPERILAILRAELRLTSDIRPVRFYQSLEEFCPLKKAICGKGMDIVVVRDISGGMFAARGKSGTLQNVRAAWDTEGYDEQQIHASARIACEIAGKRRKHVTSLDKAVLLSSSKLWREILEETAKEYPEITLEHQLVDHAAFRLVTQPEEYDVIVASNVFGDIISDEIAGLNGIGEMLPAASLNKEMKGLYTPNQLHRVFEEQAGKNTADPLGMILATAMMLEYSFSMEEEARAIRSAVESVIEERCATADFCSESRILLSTNEMGNAVRQKI
ncbi:MAG: isocitrate/isopropylmalate family dehydrogenase [Lachnospiraceae bacterium]|nr:isocitrate/isopropylmalate family dehydrogenase [Lachnospiraceae bacterium]